MPLFTPPTLAALVDVAVANAADTTVLSRNVASGLWVPANPASSGIARGTNITGSATSVPGPTGGSNNGTAVPIPNCNISVPAMPGFDVVLKAECEAQQTALGVGDATLIIFETTAGANPTTVLQRSWYLPNSTTARQNVIPMGGEVDLGPTTVTRTFQLQVRCDASTVTVPTISVVNLVAAPSYLKARYE